MYYVYMLRCTDNTIYTGITTNVERRFEEHKNKEKNCAKYTLTHQAKRIESVWETQNKALASKLEYHIKTLSKVEKEELIKKNNLEELLGNKIEMKNYIKIANYME